MGVKTFGLGLFLLATLAWAVEDGFLWLEETLGDKAIAWVDQQNSITLPTLQKDPRYKGIETGLRKILLATDRIPSPSFLNRQIYNFWQDKSHVNGLWRRTTLESYQTADPQWETVLDLDKLSVEEGGKKWVWKGATCFQPKEERCLLRLSDGGKDATEVREFDLTTKSFVANGFFIKEGPTDISWVDENTLLVGTNFGEGTLTSSDYPRTVRRWTRGTSLEAAPTIFEGKVEDVEVNGVFYIRPEGTALVLTQATSFFSAKIFVMAQEGKLQQLPFPEDANFQGVFQNHVLAQLRTDWKLGNVVHPTGAVLSLPLSEISSPAFAERLEYVYRPNATESLEGLSMGKSYLYLSVLNNVQAELRRVQKSKDGWETRLVGLPDKGTITVLSAEDFDDRLFVTYESFLKPQTFFLIEGAGEQKLIQVKQAPERFDASDLVVEQFHAVSKDGTKVPYFLVHKRGMKLEGTNPTLQYGYGGFEISLTSTYSGGLGKVWLEKGGVYALANIRGGGEFGPAWHEAALKENRQRAYDDFAAVSQDLINRKVTSKDRLGIKGGSNGGLLVGVAMTQHPDLYRAVICEVPLLDMIRYIYLHKGKSWVGEYGDPSDPAMAEVIAKYSPYQNIKEGVKYPRALFTTSTKDDRVGPEQARKMVAKLHSIGNDSLLFENREGGHAGAADLEERILYGSLQYTYLMQQLFD